VIQVWSSSKLGDELPSRALAPVIRDPDEAAKDCHTGE